MSKHECRLPGLITWDHDEDFTCQECGQSWFVTNVNFCFTCNRSDGPGWERFGSGDGSLPTISVRRGGTQWGGRR